MNDSEEQDETLALTEASTDDLRQLASAIMSGQLRTPLVCSALGYRGFGHLGRMLAPFEGSSEAALLGVIRAVLAERRRAAGKALQLVWSGPDAGPSYARYTKVVIPELIERACSQITIAGYSFDEGAGIFQYLHEAMSLRGVAVRLFLDINQLAKRLEQRLKYDKARRSRLQPLQAARQAGPAEYAAEVLSTFRDVHWPFEAPAPELYYDPRTAIQQPRASLHAKCLIVDHVHVLITSANFTGRAQDKNIEVGVVVHDAGYGMALERQWNSLIESGDVVRA